MGARSGAVRLEMDVITRGARVLARISSSCSRPSSPPAPTPRASAGSCSQTERGRCGGLVTSRSASTSAMQSKDPRCGVTRAGSACRLTFSSVSSMAAGTMSHALTCAAPRSSSATVTAPAPQPASITVRPSTRGRAAISACVNGEGVCTPGDTLIERGSPSSQMTASTAPVRLPPACVLTGREGTGAGTRRCWAWMQSQTSSRTSRSSGAHRATPSPPTAATWRSCRSSCASATSRSTTRPRTISRRSPARSSEPGWRRPRAGGASRPRARCCATAAASAPVPWTRARS